MSEVKKESFTADEATVVSPQKINDDGPDKLTKEAAVVVKNNAAEPPTRLNIIAAIANGAGVGLLLGMLLGLAISPVVSGVIGTLSGLLAVLLGVNEQYITVLKGIRVGAFGFFCVTGTLYGMYIRTNNAFLPSRTKMMEDYTKVGFTQQEARDFIAFREFDLVPSGWKSGTAANKPELSTAEKNTVKTEATQPDSAQKIIPLKAKENASSKQLAQNLNTRVFADPNATGAERKSVLYSSEIDAGACYVLSLASENQPTSEIKNTFEAAGGTWKELAQNLGAGLPEKVYIHALFTVRDCFCGSSQSGKFKISNCETASKISSKDPLEKIKQTLSSSGQIWKSIEEKVSNEIPVENQKMLYLSLIKILCHD